MAGSHAGHAPSPAGRTRQQATPQVRAAMAALPSGEMLTVIVLLKDQVGLAGIGGPDRARRQETQSPIQPKSNTLNQNHQ
jgi:hypothetical protein